MKKFFSVILVLMLVISLCACSAKPTPPPVTNGDAEVSTDGDAAKPLKVGFIYLHDEQSTYDLNFLNAAREACEKYGVEYVNKVNTPEGNECYEAAVELIDEGCTLIFADSFGHEDYMIQAARENPTIQFCHATGTKAHTENIPNYHNAFASIYEGRFLAGVAAGMKLNEMIENGEISEDEAVIGYVGAFPYAEVVSGYTSFYLGARYVCVSATMKVQFTGSWYDEALEREAANNLIRQGCVLISQHADSMGAPSACEQAGVPNVSYNGSTIDVAPNTFIVSSRINWAPYFEYLLGCMRNNIPIVTDWTGDFSTGSVEMTDVNTNVAATDTVETLAQVKEKLIAGELKVFDINTFTVDGKVVTSYMADVDSDPAYTGDTEVIIDGSFNESCFRSAPYFDLKIDGITILGE